MKAEKAEKPEKKVEAKPQPAPSSDRRFHKIGDVCELTDTQPYVLRFWESEFPQLAPMKNRSGQRLYQQKDIDLVVRIKKLLYEEEYTISGARKKLEEEGVIAPVAEPARVERSPRSAGGAASRSAAEARLLETLRKLRAELKQVKALLGGR